MHRHHRTAAALAAAASLAAATASPSAAAGGGTAIDASAAPTTLAVIGDVPYGVAQEGTFDRLIQAVNADPKVRTALHVGDIKSGSTTCSDERFAAVAAAFATFEDPVAYTPGDNEWTDCHRPNNGGYDPLERLDALRSTFFAEPGQLLGGRPEHVQHQPELVEDVRWVRSRVAFATLHVVGSDNGMAPWTGLGRTRPTEAQQAEVAARNAAVLRWVDETFDVAEDRGLRGVVLAMQADTFPRTSPAQAAVVDRVAARAARFDGEVLLLQGDSHRYVADRPIPTAANVARVVVHGEALPYEYLRLTVDPRAPQLFSWERVQVQGS